jgi:hypothetical protein
VLGLTHAKLPMCADRHLPTSSSKKIRRIDLFELYT